ncbi:MAG TPA: winged helix-turn-helix domain-containing protein [Jatrophihabitans sp.]|jgi:DNA-binding transcriptional ArsR family regulator|nr:winged helix-turn-helix domain-containing protein [Jatrophihabitans sp.]
MGVWRIGADELADSRFAVSPLLETVGALLVLQRGRPRLDLQDWYRTHRPAYRRLLAEDPTLPALLDGLFRPRWIADFIIPPPDPADRTFHDTLRRVRAAPPPTVRAVLRDGFGGAIPQPLRRVDVAARSAELLAWVWTETVRADWPRRRRILEADIVARTSQLTTGGWNAALARMRPGMRWLGSNQLQINAYDYPPRNLAGAQLSFVPNTSPYGWVAWDDANRYAVIYPCTGTLTEAGRPAERTLARLLGPARAVILTALDTPQSTTQLVALTGYRLGSVGGHLKVMREAALVTRRRAGRSVLYLRTALGNRLVDASATVRSAATPRERPRH